MILRTEHVFYHSDLCVGDAGVVPDAVAGPGPVQTGGIEGGHGGHAVLLETLQL